MTGAEEKLSALERVALRLVKDRSFASPTAPGASRQACIEAMRPVEKGAILRGALAGAFSGLIAAWGVHVAEPLYVEASASTHWTDNLLYYGVALGIAVLATILEVVYLYHDGMKSAVVLGHIGGDIPGDDEDEDLALKLALIRAGLELPCRNKPLYDIDPLVEQKRTQLLLFSLAYKLKVSATSFAMKTLMKRLAARVSGRVLGRSIIELIAVPVFAAWNAIVCRLVMMQARVRALGRHLVDELFEVAFPEGVAALDIAVQRACFLVIREKVIRATSFHHNMIVLTRRFLDEAGAPLGTPASVPGGLKAILPSLSPEDQGRVLELFALLCALDGKTSRREKRALAELQATVGRSPAPEQLDAYRRVVLEGLPLAEVASGRLTFASGGPPLDD